VQDAIQEKLTTYSTSTECFEAVVAGLWLAVKNTSNSWLTK